MIFKLKNTAPEKLIEQAQKAEERGDAQSAIALWEKVLAAQPYNTDARKSLAALYEESGDPRKAVDILDPAARECLSDQEV